MSERFTIRTMNAADLDVAVGWATKEGWNPGQGDAGPFRAADPDGFRMGFLDGEPVTSISVVAYGAAFGFLGFYICREDARGHGYGWRTWQDGIARLGGRTVGLDGVLAQIENYERSGFRLAHRNVRMSGTVAVSAPPDNRLVPLSPDDLDDVAAYDERHFPAPRRAFLREWLAPAGGRRAIGLRADGVLRGYGVIRPAVSGFKIGPLFADDAEVASFLFEALAAEAAGAPISVDPPAPNEAAVTLFAGYGLSPSFETARMYRGPAPALPLSRIFGITSFELG